jgi:hypothetical protein
MRAQLRALRLEIMQVQREINAWLKRRALSESDEQSACLLRLADFSDFPRR